MDIRTVAFSLCFLIWFIRINTISAGDCTTVFQGVPTFQNCAYRCHCKNDAQCDEQTGSCDNGCEFGWMGPGCQYRNIARFNSRTQNVGGASIPANFGTNAVDGDATTCARTTTAPGPNYQSYFRIDWDRQYRIVGLVIKIHPNNINDYNRFRVETGIGINDGDFNNICYQHDDIPGTTEMEIMCRQPVWTKHLRIILDKTYTRLRVCEVEIYGGRDVAFNKPTNQTSTYATSFSSKSVDGKPQMFGERAEDTCSTTGGGENNPYWLVDFIAEYVVQSIYFYGRQENIEQYNGFQITLIREDVMDNVYTDPANQGVADFQPKIIDLTSQRIARYLQVIRPRDNTLLTICEILSFAECPLDKCGWDCNIDCHCVAEITGTFQKDGQCPYGCSDRWTGVGNRCDNECTSTQWGHECQNKCGYCYQEESCNVVTGHCENECSGPWLPPMCTQECINNTFGINCAQTCGHCKDNAQCNISSGFCAQGCTPGWQPQMCQEECAPGTYGDGCTNTCGNCLGGVTCNPVTGICPNGCDSGFYGEKCNNVCGKCFQGVACNQTTGHCPNGCAAGFKGALCNTTCDDGEYGRDCTDTCGNCNQPSECDKQTGVCAGVCLPGWQDDMCKTPCENGTYGQNCSFECGNCTDGAPCDHETGVCQSCEPGYQLDMCQDPCQNSTYGQNCSLKCGFCKDGATCNHENGVCLSCEPGYQFDMCRDPCQNGTYGQNCSYECGNCKDGAPCHYETGVCHICEPGYQSDMCQDPCQNGSYGQNCSSECGKCKDGAPCDHENGVCLSCAPGYQLDMCTQQCLHGSYGYACANTCGNCNNTDHCHHETGVCVTGCAPGYKTQLCNEICDDGTYGQNCSHQCGSCADNVKCNTTNGVCPGGCANGFQGTLCAEAMVQPPNKPTSTGTIIGAIVGVLVVGGLACAAFIFVLRRRKMKSNSGETKHWSTATQDTLIPELNGETSVDRKEDHVYNNSAFKRHDIDVSDLRDICASAKRNPEALYKEFKEIPYGMIYDASEARDPKYKSKNRYRDMFPYNETRVLLPEIPGDELSTYINANYINGYDVPKKYIAAQGAMEATTADMWRMVWCKNVSTIVMLTNCVELGKLKCTSYWPDESSKIFGDISVELVKLEEYTDFVIRTFECKMTSTGQKREVLQFHYTAWPDKDVPDTSLSLVQFWRAVRYNQASQAVPWVVHCSAGVGRTGTFIALDFLYDLGTAKHVVNIQETVNTLREQRLNMVQTKEQYVYVHETVAEVLSPIGSVCRNDDFSDIFQTLFHDNGRPKQKLINEFEEINKYKVDVEGPRKNNEEDDGIYCNVSRSRCADAKLEVNLAKSRDMEIVPAGIHRPRLTTVVMGRNDFINAVYISTFRNRDRMILTQIPLENTIVDFLRMIWEYNCSIVVLLEECLQENFSYLPTSTSSKQFDVFTTELRNERVEDSYVMRTVSLALAGRSEQKEFCQFHFKSWPQNKSTPIDTGSILRLISDIENNNSSRGSGPIVVQCMNGATKSGLFSTLWCMLENAKSDNEIAIAETVRLNRMRRKQIIEKLDQYKYCYSVMRDYLDSFNVYANAI